jgi:tRNA pseudouridine(38-40) synthase
VEPGENYTRAGRTDTGVSAFGNVVALHLRTNELILNEDTNQLPSKIPIDYCQLINNQLPTDIRVLAVREVP